MPSRSDIHYFGAGPAPLPTEVLEEASKVLLNYNDRGIGITEISHRSAEAEAIVTRARHALRRLLDVPDGPDGYEIIFMQGGGSGQFSAAVCCMASWWASRWLQSHDPESLGAAFERLRFDYLLTGSWSLKASQEAVRLLTPQHVNIATDARKHSSTGTFDCIPPADEWKLTDRENCAMVYYCDNETVDGVEFPAFPSVLADRSDQLVADVSSNFLSRGLDVRNYAAVFAGAQKNVGTTGITIAIVKKSLLHAHSVPSDRLQDARIPRAPAVLDWPTIAQNSSLYNTLPIFDVWIAAQVMDRLLSRGIKAMALQEDEAAHKARLIYAELETFPALYHVVPEKSVRSRMNICFRVGAAHDQRPALESNFLSLAAEKNLLGCKGHRSVGGIRISNYNAVTVHSVEKLTAFIAEFAHSVSEH